MRLDVESPDEFFNLFKNQEKDVLIAVGNEVATNEEGTAIKITGRITARVFFTNEGSNLDTDTVIKYGEELGVAILPNEAWKENGGKLGERYEEIKKTYDEAWKKINAWKNKYVMSFQGKGYTVVKGVFSE